MSCRRPSLALGAEKGPFYPLNQNSTAFMNCHAYVSYTISCVHSSKFPTSPFPLLCRSTASRHFISPETTLSAHMRPAITQMPRPQDAPAHTQRPQMEHG